MTIADSHSEHIELINDIRNFADILNININFTIDFGFNNSKSLDILNTTEHICEHGMERDLKNQIKYHYYYHVSRFINHQYLVVFQLVWLI